MQKSSDNKVVNLLCLLAIILTPALGWAGLVVRTQVVSGKIAQIIDAKTVKLDNDQVYTSSRETLKMTLRPGDPVTLKYYVGQGSDKKVYFEYQPGLNSIPVDKTWEPKASERSHK